MNAEDKIVTIAKEFTFDSSHRLINEAKGEEWNKEKYGKCHFAPSHGHRYKLIVYIRGNIQEDGMVMNFVDLKELVTQDVIDVCDHHFLNDLDIFKGTITTCENMIYVIWDILEDSLRGRTVELAKLILYETPTSFAVLEK